MRLTVLSENFSVDVIGKAIHPIKNSYAERSLLPDLIFRSIAGIKHWLHLHMVSEVLMRDIVIDLR